MKRKAETDLESLTWVEGPLLGKGSFGAVYIAYSKDKKNNALPRTMAVKRAKLTEAFSLVRERANLEQFRGCANIIQCYGKDITESNDDVEYDDDGDDGGTKVLLCNLLLEYAEGGALSDFISNKYGGCGLPQPQVRHFAKCILQGLYQIHESGYVHCDLKPDNILLSISTGDASSSSSGSEYVAKIADFGLAKKMGSTSTSFYLRGTPLYMSPEVVNGCGQEGPSDIWAFGCVVLCMLTGQPPWNMGPDSTIEDLFGRIAAENESPVVPCNISKDGKDFLKSCFARDPALRPTAFELLTHPFLQPTKQIEIDQEALEKGETSTRLSPSSGFAGDFGASFIPLDVSLPAEFNGADKVITDYDIVPHFHSCILSKPSFVPVGA